MNETDTKDQMPPAPNTGEITITEAIEKLQAEQGLSVEAAADKLGIHFSAYYADRKRPVAQRRLLSSVHYRAEKHRAYAEDERRAFVERVEAYMAKHDVTAKKACHDCKLNYSVFLKHRAALGLTRQANTGPVIFKRYGITPIQNSDGSWSAGCPKCEKDWTVANMRRLGQRVSRHLVTVHRLRINRKADQPLDIVIEPETPPAPVPAPEPTSTDTFYCPHCGTHLSLDVQVNLKSVTAHR